jgi:hypothetical protein
LQILLVIPFYKAAARMINSGILQDFPGSLIAEFNTDWWGAFNGSFQVILTAFLIWLVLSIPLYLLVRKMTSAILFKLKTSKEKASDL